MRIVLCDEDTPLREMVESLVTRLGHEIVGIADTTAAGVALLEVGRPDVVIYDMSLGYNTDFDVIETARLMGTKTILFAHTADEAILSRYPERPTVVPKPDLAGLEEVLSRLHTDPTGGGVVEQERRRHMTRALGGNLPTGVNDAQAFYEALNDARAGDAMISIEFDGDSATVGEQVLEVMRSSDRLLASTSSLKVFLVDGGTEGIEAFLRRVAATGVLPDQVRIASIVVRDAEAPVEAFERLKDKGEARRLS